MRLPWRKSDAPAIGLRSEPTYASFSTIEIVDIPWATNDGQGSPVTREMAIAVPAVLRGRNLIVGTIASMPIVSVDATNNPVVVPLLAGNIDPDVANIVTVGQTVEDLLFEGIAWWRVLQRGFDKYPTQARHVQKTQVNTSIPNDFPINKLPSGYYPGSHVFIRGEAVPVAEMIRFDSPNPPLLVAASRPIRRLLKLVIAADKFADDPAMRSYFTAADGADPSQDDINGLLADWKTARQNNSTGYVPAGFVLNDASVLTPADAQLQNLIQQAALDIANAIGVDPEDLGLSTTSRTYRNQVDRRQDQINQTYSPYSMALTQRLSMGDITKRGVTVRLDWDDYLRANPIDRMTVQTGYLAAEVITRDEVRDEEYLAPMTPEQEMSFPAPAPAPAAAAPAPVHPRDASFADEEPAVTFASAVSLAFESDEQPGLSVNKSRREITGLVMPWGAVGRSGGRRWMFDPGSLKFNASEINRMKLLIDHANSAPVGKTIRTWSDEVGQWATFKVTAGPEGDRALAMAADGTRDGLSAGVGYDGEDSGMTFAADGTDGTVMRVTSAPWRETSLVSIPAFDDARVSAVRLSADDQGANMPDQATAEPAVPVAAPVNYSADQMAAMFAMFANGQGAQAQTIAAPVETPAVVNPIRETAATHVAEKPLYRFDGGTAQRCFSGDMGKAANGNDDARRYLDTYMASDEMAAQFANLTPANVAAVNPVLTRPELYVPNLVFNAPLRSLVTTGPLDSLIAFIAPKFSSSSGLVASHVTNTEPTQGAYAMTTQTITPVGLSGRVDVAREIVDSGGSPQADQIIYGDMAREYVNQLEKRIEAAFVALSLSDTPVVGTSGDLQAALLQLFAGFQFLRGGDSFSSLGMESGLYKAVVGATDSNGRPLFPMNGAVNADGSVSGDMASVRVGPKLGRPAWALEAANGGNARSYLFNPSVAYQWSSGPRSFRFDQVNVSSVGIAIWGYSAEAITRSSDIYQLSYSAG